MFMRSTPFIPIAVFILTLALLGWGYLRSRKFGKLGLLSWLQFVALMSPWLVYFGLFVSGVFITFTTLLFLLLSSTIAYVVIGNQLRKAALAERAEIEQKLKQDLEVSIGDRPNLSSDLSNTPPINTPIALAMAQGKTQLKVFQAVPAEEMKQIQGIFGIETYYVTETIPYQEGAIFKGNLRGEPDVVHDRLSNSLRDRLDDKYNLFLVEGKDQKPVMIVLPTKVNAFAENNTIPQKVLIAVLIVANSYTALNLGAQVAGIPIVQTPAE